MKRDHKFPYKWNLSDGYPAPGIKYHGRKVFSCFACGGGSTMGYKLAGFDVIGANDIDPQMAEVYKANHNPKHYFVESITNLKDREDLPPELYDLDILDGSPPCSSFSMAGNRDKDWGKKKKFREGQSQQVLDTLFFDFIDLAARLRPKVVIAENVKGIILGNAIKYVAKIRQEFDKAGYYVNWWLLDASKMGVPQRRERVFFVAVRKDICPPEILGGLFADELAFDMEFAEQEILAKEILTSNIDGSTIALSVIKLWHVASKQKIFGGLNKVHPKGSFFNEIIVNPNEPFRCLTSKGKAYHPEIPRRLSDFEFCLASSFPQDYQFCESRSFYVSGMSVPPVMMAQVADRVRVQVLDKITNQNTI